MNFSFSTHIKHILATFLLVVGLPLQLHADSADTIWLNEKWLFKLSRSEAQTPKDYYSTQFNDTQWGFQSIPGLWRTPRGWGRENYVGVYRGWIKLPETFSGRRIMLHMGFATNVADIFLNGEKIGNTAPDRAQTEIDITALVHPGERDLYVFHMPHYQDKNDSIHIRGKAGILNSCYIYALDPDHDPDAGPAIGKAKKGVRVGDRYNVRLTEDFTDTEKTMKSDLEKLAKMGFTAVTYEKITSSPEFIDYARSHGFDVVSNAPESTEPLVDDKGNYLPVAYSLLPEPDYDYKSEAKLSEATGKGMKKVKPKLRDEKDMVYVSDVNYYVAFDKQSGMMTSYTLSGNRYFASKGCIRPNADISLVTLTYSKPSKTTGTKVTAVYQKKDGTKLEWVYNIAINGLLTIDIDGESDLLITPEKSLNKTTYLAQDFGPNVYLSSIDDYRPHVYWVMMCDATGKGMKAMLQETFTAFQTPRSPQVLIRPQGKKATLQLLPMD